MGNNTVVGEIVGVRIPELERILVISNQVLSFYDEESEAQRDCVTDPKLHRKLMTKARIQASWFPIFITPPPPHLPCFSTFSGQVSMCMDTRVIEKTCKIGPRQRDEAAITKATLRPHLLQLTGLGVGGKACWLRE